MTQVEFWMRGPVYRAGFRLASEPMDEAADQVFRDIHDEVEKVVKAARIGSRTCFRCGKRPHHRAVEFRQVLRYWRQTRSVRRWPVFPELVINDHMCQRCGDAQEELDRVTRASRRSLLAFLLLTAAVSAAAIAYMLAVLAIASPAAPLSLVLLLAVVPAALGTLGFFGAWASIAERRWKKQQAAIVEKHGLERGWESRGHPVVRALLDAGWSEDDPEDWMRSPAEPLP
jgi:hypothetical protein